MHKTALLETWYRRIALVSVGAVLFLILVGGIVRSTGSGMGCPDWPKCFGLWVPPTQVDEIPLAFFESHPQFETKTFNAFQTWVEYVNRLVGATIGLLMLLTAGLSLTFLRKDPRIVVLSVLALLMTGFEGWLGKLVVDRNLAGGMVTLHMLFAILIVEVLILANYLVAARSGEIGERSGAKSPVMGWLGAGTLLLTTVQLLVGTRVRETVDAMNVQLGGLERSEWLQPSLPYSIHKITWMVLAVVLGLWLKQVFTQLGSNRRVRLLAWVIIVSVVLEVLMGMILAYKDLPPVVQPVHMLLANIILAAEFSIWIHVVGVENWLSGKKNTVTTLQDGAMMNAER